MDVLAKHDIALSRQLSPERKLAQAFRMMEAGLRLKRAALKHEYPNADTNELERKFSEWLMRDD